MTFNTVGNRDRNRRDKACLVSTMQTTRKKNPMKKFKNKYRIPSARLQNWDYGWNATYFITICTQNRECYFGEIVQDEMQLSHLGILADVFWHEIKHHTPNVESGAFVVMPNHVHGILVLDGNSNVNNGEHCNDGDDRNVANAANAGNAGNVETRHALSLQSQSQSQSISKSQQPPSPQPPQTIGQKRFQNQGKNTLSSIIGSYKSAVTKHAHRLGYDFAWQTRFHDHIIRDAESYHRIEQYTLNNPRNWKKDKFYRS